MQQERLFYKVLSRTSKKLVLVLEIFAPITEASKKDNIALDRVLCIYYPIWFKKNEVQTLINSGSEINAIELAYILKLGLKIRLNNIEV